MATDLGGTVVVRLPLDEEELAQGEVVCFPPGPAGAHKVTNRGETVARVMMFSSAREPAVAVYPDSDKIGVWPGQSRRQGDAPAYRWKRRLLGRGALAGALD